MLQPWPSTPTTVWTKHGGMEEESRNKEEG